MRVWAEGAGVVEGVAGHEDECIFVFGRFGVGGAGADGGACESINMADGVAWCVQQVEAAVAEKVDC